MKMFFDRMMREDDGKGGGDGQQQQQQQQSSGGDGQQQQQQPFYSSFGFDAEKDKAALTWLGGKNFSDARAFVQSAMETEKTARDRNAISLPEKGKELEWAGFEKLGWNPDVAKYDIAPAQLPEGVELDQEEFDTAKGLMHKARVAPAQARMILDGMQDLRNKRMEAIKTRGAASMKDLDTALRSEWGADYDAKSEIAKRAAMTFGIGADDMAQIEKITGAPNLLKKFHEIGVKLSEAKILDDGKSRSGNLPDTVEALDAELARLQSNPEWMAVFNNPRHAQHAEHVKQRQNIIDRKGAILSRRSAV